jgi:hypothetical protein
MSGMSTRARVAPTGALAAVEERILKRERGHWCWSCQRTKPNEACSGSNVALVHRDRASLDDGSRPPGCGADLLHCITSSWTCRRHRLRPFARGDGFAVRGISTMDSAMRRSRSSSSTLGRYVTYFAAKSRLCSFRIEYLAMASFFSAQRMRPMVGPSPSVRPERRTAGHSCPSARRPDE